LFQLLSVFSAKEMGPMATAVLAGLTAGEQRLVSVILAAEGPRVGFDLERALFMSNPGAAPSEAPFDGIRAPAGHFEGRAEGLQDGWVMVTLQEHGSATDQALQAARCALAIREVWPDASFALATGRGMLQGRQAVGEVIDRAVALLDAGFGAPAQNPD